jgi:hypothetical protein
MLSLDGFLDKKGSRGFSSTAKGSGDWKQS